MSGKRPETLPIADTTETQARSSSSHSSPDLLRRDWHNRPERGNLAQTGQPEDQRRYPLQIKRMGEGSATQPGQQEKPTRGLEDEQRKGREMGPQDEAESSGHSPSDCSTDSGDEWSEEDYRSFARDAVRTAAEKMTEEVTEEMANEVISKSVDIVTDAGKIANEVATRTNKMVKEEGANKVLEKTNWKLAQMSDEEIARRVKRKIVGEGEVTVEVAKVAAKVKAEVTAMATEEAAGKVFGELTEMNDATREDVKKAWNIADRVAGSVDAYRGSIRKAAWQVLEKATKQGVEDVIKRLDENTANGADEEATKRAKEEVTEKVKEAASTSMVAKEMKKEANKVAEKGKESGIEKLAKKVFSDAIEKAANRIIDDAIERVAQDTIAEQRIDADLSWTTLHWNTDSPSKGSSSGSTTPTPSMFGMHGGVDQQPGHASS